MAMRLLYIALGTLTLLLWVLLEVISGTVKDVVAGSCALLSIVAGLAFVAMTLYWMALRRRLPPLVGLVVGILGLLLVLHALLPGGEGVVDRRLTANGTEMVATQSYDGEPYRVHFYFRRPGGKWGWFYYEHEDTRWIRGLSHIRLSADQQQATLCRLFLPVATFDLQKETFTIRRWNRTMPVQSTRPEDWSPEAAYEKPDPPSVTTIKTPPSPSSATPKSCAKFPPTPTSLWQTPPPASRLAY